MGNLLDAMERRRKHEPDPLRHGEPQQTRARDPPAGRAGRGRLGRGHLDVLQCRRGGVVEGLARARRTAAQGRLRRGGQPRDLGTLDGGRVLPLVRDGVIQEHDIPVRRQLGAPHRRRSDGRTAHDGRSKLGVHQVAMVRPRAHRDVAQRLPRAGREELERLRGRVHALAGNR